MGETCSYEEWSEAEIKLVPLAPSHRNALLGAVAAIRTHVPDVKLRSVPNSDRHLPTPCPWADEMMDHYNWIKLKEPLSRDRFRELFQIYHLALIDEQFCRDLPVKKLLSNLIIGSSNPFNECEELFCTFREEIPEHKQVLWEMPEYDLSAVANKIKEVSREKVLQGQVYCFKQMSFPADDMAFYHWYMDDANFYDAQAYFCLSSIIMLMAHVHGPREIYFQLQCQPAASFTRLSFRSPPVYHPYVKKEAVYQICENIASDKAPELMRQVLMAFDYEKYTEWDWSKGEILMARFLLNFAPNAARFNLLKHLEAARKSFGKIEEVCCEDPKLRESLQKCLDTKRLIEFYEKGKPFERGGQTFHFKYWAFAKVFESACFKEIAKKDNVEFLAFCVAIAGGGHERDMFAIKSNPELAQPYFDRADTHMKLEFELWRESAYLRPR